MSSVWPVAEPAVGSARAVWAPCEDLPAEEHELVERCRQAADVPFPAADAPSAEEAKALAECDAEALYYGIGVPVDFAQARRCAYAYANSGKGAVMGGAEILMLVYANGNGVPKNFAVARRFATAVPGSLGELDVRLTRLTEASETGHLEGTMDMCDDVGSGFMSGYCAAHAERIAGAERDIRKRIAIANMPTAALQALERAAEHYFDVHSRQEVDLTGTARAMFQIEEQMQLRDAFVTTLEQLHDPAFAPPHADPQPLEREMARRMAEASRRTVPPAMLGMVTASGIRNTQAAWLAYRDKLVAFTQRVRPDIAATDWRAHLDQVRLEQLRELTGNDCCPQPAQRH